MVIVNIKLCGERVVPLSDLWVPRVSIPYDGGRREYTTPLVGRVLNSSIWYWMVLPLISQERVEVELGLELRSDILAT